MADNECLAWPIQLLEGRIAAAQPAGNLAQNDPQASARIPELGVGCDSVVFLSRTNGGEFDSSLHGNRSKHVGSDERHAVSASTQFAADHNERIDVARRPYGR